MMSFAGELSKYILVPIFLEWCKIADIVQLDSAICNKKIRPVFEEWMREFNHKFQQSFFPMTRDLAMSLKLFEWNLMRNIQYDRQRIIICDKQLTVFRELSEVQKKKLSEVSTSFDAVNIKINSLDNASSLRELLGVFASLNFVRLVDCPDINKIVPILSERFHALETCIMSHSPFLSDEVMLTFCQGCPNIRSLDLNGCQLITDRTLYSISIHCNQLFYLNIKGCSRISLRAISMWALHPRRRRHCTVDFDHYTDLLTRLYIHHYRYAPNSWDLSSSVRYSIVDRTLEEMALYNYNVFEVNLQYCNAITDNSFVPAMQQFARLTSINIKGVTQLTDASIQAMCTHCPSLGDITVGCQLMVTEWCWAALAQCKNLMRLTLVKVNLGMALKTILVHCTQLMHLLMGDVRGLTDSVWIDCAPHTSHLEKITMSDLKEIGDMGLMALSLYTSGLKTFNIISCPKVTDAGIIDVVKNSPQLIIIGFQDIKLTKYLIRACVRIKAMTIWRNNTGKSYLNKGQIIMNRCKKLLLLQLEHVSDEETSKLNELAQDLVPGLMVSNILRY